jgi:hypothetical protein
MARSVKVGCVSGTCFHLLALAAVPSSLLQLSIMTETPLSQAPWQLSIMTYTQPQASLQQQRASVCLHVQADKPETCLLFMDRQQAEDYLQVSLVCMHHLFPIQYQAQCQRMIALLPAVVLCLSYQWDHVHLHSLSLKLPCTEHFHTAGEAIHHLLTAFRRSINTARTCYQPCGDVEVHVPVPHVLYAYQNCTIHYSMGRH